MQFSKHDMHSLKIEVHVHVHVGVRAYMCVYMYTSVLIDNCSVTVHVSEKGFWL